MAVSRGVEQVVEAPGLAAVRIEQGIQPGFGAGLRPGLAGSRVDLEWLAAAGTANLEDVSCHGRSRLLGAHAHVIVPGASADFPASTRDVTAEQKDQARPGTHGERLRSAAAVTDAADPTPPESVLPDQAEQALVVRARDGDEEAFRELVELHQDQILRLAMRVLRCDPALAEDAAQEVFLRVFRGLPRFDGALRFRVWVHKIAMNVCISAYRKDHSLKRGSRRTVSLDRPVVNEPDARIDPPARVLGPAERAQELEFADRVRFAVADLPDEFRLAILLRDMQGLSYEEVAQTLDIPVGTVRSRLHRGRQLLQAALAEFGS